MLKGFRTLLVNFLMAVVPVLQLTELADVMPDEWLSYYALAVVLLNMFLRYITTTPVGRSE
jgi:uncharacterized integral membrane protein